MIFWKKNEFNESKYIIWPHGKDEIAFFDCEKEDAWQIETNFTMTGARSAVNGDRIYIIGAGKNN